MDRVYMDKDGFHIEGSRAVITRLREACDKALSADRSTQANATFDRSKQTPVDIHPELQMRTLPITVKITRA